MSERRGTVILVRRGDAEITGAIVAGMLAARGDDLSCPCGAPSPEGEGLGENGRGMSAEEIEVVEAEIDRQKIEADLLRIATGNTNTAEDYRLMMTKVRGDCARYTRPIGPARKLARLLLGVYGLIVYALTCAYRAQDRVLVSRGRVVERRGY